MLGPWSSALYAGVLATVLWAPLPFGSVEPWAVGLLRLAALALACVWAVGCAARGALVVATSPMQLAVFGAAALALLQSLPLGSATVSADPFSSRQSAWTIGALGILFSVALVALDRRDRLRRAGVALLLVGFGLSVFAILQSLSGTTKLYWIRETTAQLFFGPFANKNHFAGLMEVLVAPALGLLATGAVARDRRPLVAFAALVIAVAVVLSRSRGGLFSLVLEVVVLGVLALVTAPARSGSTARRALVGVAGALALAASVVVGVVWVGAEAVAGSLADLPDAVSAESPISRIAIWRDTLGLVRDHPALGAGIGAYATSFGPYTRSTGTVLVQHAHSDYLQVLADGGVAGAVLAILFVATLSTHIVRGIRRTDPVARGIAIGASAGCIGLLIHSFVDFNMQIPSNALAFLFAAALVARASTVDGGAHLVRREVP